MRQDESVPYTSLKSRRRVRIPHLAAAKAAGEKITMLTAYDFVTAGIFDRAGVDMLLVGDSLGNVMHGHETTLPVELDELVVATRAVARATQRALVVADLPFGTYEASPEQAHASAVRLMKAGASAVKFEGGERVAPQVRLLASSGIPVIGHLGFTPQLENAFGGKRIQGRTEDAANVLVDDAYALAEAGASAVVLEMVPAPVAARVTEVIPVPTIGIGAGADVDGQVLVWTDMAGMTQWSPTFARQFAHLGSALKSATMDYVEAVRSVQFPGPEHSFTN
ncbi:MAG: 3-methyl-2-oxobutanoate hydroxymethyltransferase [Buchananella hordeovulneris]|nr:3-methyl-2-oxobutanoate hydroxymethyltransferase [Buchananella hordeovulneris]